MVAWLQKCTCILLPLCVLPSNPQLALKALRIVLSAVQTNTVEKNQVTSAQMWVLLLGQLVFLVWLLVLNKVQVSRVILCKTTPHSTYQKPTACTQCMAAQPWVPQHVYRLVYIQTANNAVGNNA